MIPIAVPCHPSAFLPLFADDPTDFVPPVRVFGCFRGWLPLRGGKQGHHIGEPLCQSDRERRNKLKSYRAGVARGAGASGYAPLVHAVTGHVRFAGAPLFLIFDCKYRDNDVEETIRVRP